MVTQIWLNNDSGNGLYLMAPSHHLNQCWYVISWFSGIHLGAILQELLQKFTCKMCLRNTLLKSLPQLPGSNKLMISEIPIDTEPFLQRRLWTRSAARISNTTTIGVSAESPPLMSVRWEMKSATMKPMSSINETSKCTTVKSVI